MTVWREWDICKQTAAARPLEQVQKRYCVNRWSPDNDHDEIKCNPDAPLTETRACDDPGTMCMHYVSICILFFYFQQLSIFKIKHLDCLLKGPRF